MGYRNITLTMTMIWLFKAIENKEETKKYCIFYFFLFWKFFEFLFLLETLNGEIFN